MNFCFTGKTFLVTGAGRGIGRALVKALVKSGGKVYALSRTKEPLDSLVKYSDKIYPVVIDISDWDRTRSVVEKLDTFDGVVNNAGYHPGNGLTAALDCPKERFEIAFNTNTLAAVNIIQTAGKKMVQRGNGGAIVNVSSVQGFNPGRGACFYSITKAALDMVTKQYALELGPHNIRVNSVNPGLVNTVGVKMRPGYQEIGNAIQALTPLGRICTEMECVYPIMYFLSDQASMVTGCLHVVDGGWLSRLPY